MSPARSRNGGRWISTTRSRKNKSSRNVPALTSSSRFLLVAAIEPGVGGQRLVGADALKGAFAQKAQQLHLDGRVNLADFIQKQRPALRLLEAADAPLVRAGERALFVAEQFALQQRRRQRRAMHRHQRLLGARTQLVDRPAP